MSDEPALNVRGFRQWNPRRHQILGSLPAGGYIGLWQINVAVPSGLTGSAVPVRIIINGTPSNTVTIAVR